MKIYDLSVVFLNRNYINIRESLKGIFSNKYQIELLIEVLCIIRIYLYIRILYKQY